MAVACSALHAESYHIGPGDVLEISVWRDDALSREIVIPPDGILSFPLIGDVNVANMSVAQIRDVIKKRLSEYIPDASVSVIHKTDQQPESLRDRTGKEPWRIPDHPGNPGDAVTCEGQRA